MLIAEVTTAGIDGERWKMPVKLITDNILDLTPDFWLKVGDKIHDWVLDDCRAGIMQDNTANHAYQSKQYMKYKANRMERFTTRKYKDGTVANKGTKLKSLGATSVVSTQINPVNMILTQRTINGLMGKNPTKDSITMHFNGIPAGILTGNRDRGYDIIGLNDKNREKVKQKILNQFDENIRKTIAPTIIIEVS